MRAGRIRSDGYGDHGQSALPQCRQHGSLKWETPAITPCLERSESSHECGGQGCTHILIECLDPFDHERTSVSPQGLRIGQ